MKLIILFFFTIFFSYSNAQGVFSNFEGGSVELKNGKLLEGYVKMKENDDIVFRVNLEESRISFKKEDIKTVVKSGVAFFYLDVIKGNKTEVKALQLSMDGGVQLYFHLKVKNTPNGHGGGYYSAPNAEKHFYLSTKEESFVTSIKFANTYSKKFSRIASKYFKDCDELIQKIENRGFERNDIEGIVNYYNSECGND